MTQHRILVPVDFTPVSTNAVNHAIAVGKALNSELHLVHIVAKKNEFGEARERLEAFAKDLLKAFDGPAKTTVRIGNLFDDIDDVSVEMDANLVIMGTHGLKGMQFITGGRALKIVRECSVPFIITQSRPIRETGYDDIVVPLDLHQDTKQKLAIVAEMATYFKGRVHIISPAESDEFLGTSCGEMWNSLRTISKNAASNTPPKSASTIQVHSSRTWCATQPPLKPT